MRKRVIAILDFPRRVVRGEMELFECPHNGEFDNDDRKCKECTDGSECEWLYATDAVAALGSRSLSQLSEALEFAITAVAANVIEKDHDPQQCGCQMCGWLAQAELLSGNAGQLILPIGFKGYGVLGRLVAKIIKLKWHFQLGFFQCADHFL